MINHTNDIVGQMAQDNFNELMDFVQALQGRSRRRGGASAEAKADAENKALDCLLKAFEEAARFYFGEARKLIQRESTTSRDKIRDYHRVLCRLTDHALLLSDLARPPIAAGAHIGADDKIRPAREKSQQLFNRNRTLVEKVMAIIGARLESPPLHFLISSQSFRHVRFNYMSGICAIGIPPHVLAKPSWNLSVLWHEIAAHYVALKHKELKKWAEALSDVWEGLREIYEQSFLHELGVRIERKGEGKDRTYRITRYKGDAGEEWEADWLGEFFEDLFGVQALGGTMVEIMADVLVQRYERFDLGDAKHPPPNLRLEVALGYLGLVGGNAGETRSRLDNRYGLEELELQSSSDKYPNSNLATAQTIAKFLKGKLDDIRSSPDHDGEPDLPGIIGRAHRQSWGEEEGEEVQFPQELYQRQDVETQLSLDCRPVASFMAGIKAATDDLDTLLRVEFASFDMHVDSASGASDMEPWPPESLSGSTGVLTHP